MNAFPSVQYPVPVQCQPVCQTIVVQCPCQNREAVPSDDFAIACAVLVSLLACIAFILWATRTL